MDGLIIPGGESTTIAKLAVQYNLMEPLQQFASHKPVWGTCAGMIFMAKDIGLDQPLLNLMDIVVERNAFGRQVDSFITDLQVPALGNGRSFPAVFIRRPPFGRSKGPSSGIGPTGRWHGRSGARGPLACHRLPPRTH